MHFCPAQSKTFLRSIRPDKISFKILTLLWWSLECWRCTEIYISFCLLSYETMAVLNQNFCFYLKKAEVPRVSELCFTLFPHYPLKLSETLHDFLSLKNLQRLAVRGNSCNGWLKWHNPLTFPPDNDLPGGLLEVIGTFLLFHSSNLYEKS